MTYLAGKVVLDIDAGAPNNGRGEDNKGMVKSAWIGRQRYPYVSAQAFRRWLRDSLPAGEPRSQVIRSGSGASQQAYTKGRPDQFLDDDLFGYMVAVKAAKGSGGKSESCQRDTVLATGTLLSTTPQQPTMDFGTMTRGFQADEAPVIHEHEHYTADLAGDVLLDLPRVGTFSTDGSGLRIALTARAATEARESGAIETILREQACVQLPLTERRRRVAVLLRTLAAVQGGAKKALHYGERSPALVLLAPVAGGINPFTRVVTARPAGDSSDGGRRPLATVLDTDILAEEIDAWQDQLNGAVRIGWAPGFLGDQREKTRAQLSGYIDSRRLIIDHPRRLLRQFAEEFEAGGHDAWFEDPTGE